jgi:fucose permease
MVCSADCKFTSDPLLYVSVVECLVQIGDPVSEQGASGDSKFRQILRQKTVHFLALFSLVYIGVEFTIGGLLNTFRT